MAVAAPPLDVISPLGPGALTAVALTATEALSRPFSLDLEVAAPPDAPVPFDALLGRPATVTLQMPAGVRHFHGIVSRFSAGGSTALGRTYHLLLEPELTRLALRRDSRIFQLLSVPEILRLVLDGVPADVELQTERQPRDRCVQFGETDFAFLSRLLEEEGIFYFFRHQADRHRLVLADSPESHPDVPAPTTLRFEPALARRGEPAILSWEKSQELRAGKVTLRDHEFQLPGDPLEATASLPESVRAGQVEHRLRVPGTEQLEVYDYPGLYAGRFDGIDRGGGEQPGELAKLAAEATRTAALRVEEQATGALTIAGASTYRNLVAGHRFVLTGHVDADGPYVLTSVQHNAWLVDAKRGLLEYANTFTCIPAGVPFRPPRTTPRPSLAGVHTGVVVGPPGEVTHADRYGRVKVQFHWDRLGRGDASSSWWIRVLQHEASSWLPEVGDEVLVAFEHGEPDRPYVLGRVYNPDRPPPERRD